MKIITIILLGLFVMTSNLLAGNTRIVFAKTFSDGMRIVVQEEVVREFSKPSDNQMEEIKRTFKKANPNLVGYATPVTDGLLRYEMLMSFDDTKSTKIWEMDREFNEMGVDRSGILIHDVEICSNKIAVMYSRREINSRPKYVDIIEHDNGKVLSKTTYEVFKSNLSKLPVHLMFMGNDIYVVLKSGSSASDVILFLLGKDGTVARYKIQSDTVDKDPL